MGIGYKKVLVLLPFAVALISVLIVRQGQDSTEKQPQQVADKQVEKVGFFSSAQELSFEQTVSDEKAAPEINTEIVELLPAHLIPRERLTKTLDALRQRFIMDGRNIHHPGAWVDDAYLEFRNDLTLAIEQDPALLEELVDIFVQEPGSLLGKEISAVLAENGAPEVQSAALDIGLNAHHYSHNERSAALIMVAYMDTVSGDTRDRLLAHLSSEQDSLLLQLSILGLRPAPSTQDDYARVQEALNGVITSEDEHVRRHAAYQIERWSTTNEDLESLRTMATEDEAVNARARAVMSIGMSSFKSDDNKAVLLDAMNDEEEWAPLRWEAWKLLHSYPLSESEVTDYSEIGEQLELAVTALRKGGE